MQLSVPHLLRATIAVALVLSLTGVGPAAPAGARLPVESYPAYQPQTTCSPWAKTGTLMLARHLLARYPGSGSSGISRSCTASGVSEHKEGRAFDWRLSAATARDRRFARNFLGRLRATDRRGHRNALARRMGIMYVIWNDHIWSASSGYRRRDYLHGACTRPTTCSVTLRHRDHMHISLSRRAARAQTSWYLHRRGAPATPVTSPSPTPPPQTEPVPRLPRLPEGIVDLRRRPYRKITVRPDGGTVTSTWKLQAGKTYSLSAAGLYTFGTSRQVGDAACTWSTRHDTWVPEPAGRTKRRFGRLALKVNGTLPFGRCNPRTHRYRTTLTPARDQFLRLELLGRHTAASGRLTVVLGRARTRAGALLPTYPALTPEPTRGPAREGYGLVAETVTVPGSATTSSRSVGGLDPRARYLLTVRGSVRLGSGVRSNGQCVRVRGTWYRKASIDLRAPDQNHGGLYVNGIPFRGRSTSGCTSRQFTTEFRPDVRGRLQLDLWDPLDRADNTGELVVRVQRTTPIPTPAPAGKARPSSKVRWTQGRDRLAVNSRLRRGNVSTMRLRRGDSVRVIVDGRFTSGGYAADASCVRSSTGWATTFPDALGQDPLSLWVDGRPVRWRALGRAISRAAGCSAESLYVARFTATKNGPLRLAVFDLDHRDNSGRLGVTLRRVR